MSLGAEIHSEEPAREWKVVGDGVEVTTDKGTYHAAKLVVTAGAWATKLLTDIGVPLRVMRQTLLWFNPKSRPEAFRRDNFPIFIADVPGAPFYGLPAIDHHFGLKIARHYDAPELPNPDGVGWNRPRRRYRSRDASVDRRAHSGAWGTHEKGQGVYMYTVTPDHHFVLDTHPEHPRVSVACGFSGHGFKFATTVGEIMADLAEQGRTKHDIAMFSARRFVART